MIYCDSLTLERWTAPPQEDFPRPPWTKLIAHGVLLSNSVEYANWADDPVEPIVCEGCWCPACARSLEPLRAEWAPGVPLIAAGRLEGPWQRAVHSFKYLPRPHLAAALARPLEAAVLESGLALSALAWIPLHPLRERERGFNQSERVARVLARSLGVPLCGGLRRVRPTAPQVELSQAARRANVAGAFRWQAPAPPPGLGLGLVDDVLTTGATLQAAEAALAAAGGRLGAVLVLAVRGEGRPLVAQTLPDLAVTSPGKDCASR